MAKLAVLAIGCLGFLWPVFCGAQQIPSVRDWTQIFQQVRQHPLFRELDIRYAKAPAENVGYTPVGVILDRDVGCSVVIAEGDNPKMRAILSFGATPEQRNALLLVAAAHELGHCLRVRQKQVSAQFWSLVESTDEGSAQRLFLERQASIEESYADAYALVYIQDTHPGLFQEALDIMKNLRAAPGFATPYYQVQPLYEQLARHGFDANLPLRARVEVAVQRSKFPAD